MRHLRRPPISLVVSSAALVATLWSLTSLAAPPLSEGRVEIEADELDSDLAARDLSLRGHVVIRGERFRIRSSALRMIRGEDGSIRLVGPLEVAPCACDNPPLWFSVDSAEIDARSASVSLRGATAQVGGVPVFWSPWLSLRGPSSVGLVAPRLAWRGRDGLLIGAGVHLPLGASSWVESSPAVYTEGGYDLLSSLHTARSETSVRWDRRHHDDLVDVTSRGALTVRDGSFGWSIDAIRGSRATVASISLDSASRAFDRADATWTSGREGGLFSTSVRVAATRGVGDVAVGPRVAVHRAFTIGTTVGAVSADFSSIQLRDSVWNLARADVDLSSSIWLGAVRLDGLAHGASMLADLTDSSRASASMHARAGAALPIYKAYSSTLVHVIEPSLSVSGFSAKSVLSTARDTQSVVDPSVGMTNAMSNGAMLIPTVAIDHRLGDAQGHGWRFAIAGGSTVSSEQISPLVRARTSLGGRWVSVSGDALAQHASDTTSGIAMGTLELAPAHRLSVGVDSSIRKGADPILVRWLLPSVVSQIGSAGWIASDGISAGATTRVPLRERLWLSARVDRDMSARTWLGQRVELRYGDACGCLALSAVVAHRLGREGVVVMVGLDLSPR